MPEIGGALSCQQMLVFLLWPLPSKCGHYVFALWFLSSIFFFLS